MIDLLVGVDVTKSTGPDNIVGRMIKSTACSITSAVTALFNQKIRQGKIPNDWKTACITPVEPVSVVSGVPQGSVLRPLLFLIYIDDVSQIIFSNGSLLVYADDIVLYHPIYCQEDYNSLQNDVDSLCDWTSSAFLNLNAAKCKYMIISRKKQPIVPLTPILMLLKGLTPSNIWGFGSLKTSHG